MTGRLSVRPVGTVAGVRGDRVACRSARGWAAAERRFVTLDRSAELTPPRAIDGPLRFSAGGDALLAGSERLDLPAARWTPLPDPRSSVAAGTGPLDVTAAAWDAAGETLAVAAERPAARPAGGGASTLLGPQAWLTLLQGSDRATLRPLWQGDAPGPRHVAVEGGVVAADVGGRARVWVGDKELAPDGGPIIDLALGDGGSLLALVGLDGSVSAWRGPRFGEREPLGEGAQGAIAVAAAAPVVAWARADGAAVWAGGRTVVLDAPAIRAVALDADGTRLVALDVASKLHDAAIAR